MLSEILFFLVSTLVAVIIFTGFYHLLPFRVWRANKNPKLVWFPKYVTTFDYDIEILKGNLLNLGFKRKLGSDNVFIRGRIFGDFSAGNIKLHAEIENNKLKIFAPYFGILFDSGDLWVLVKSVQG